MKKIDAVEKMLNTLTGHMFAYDALCRALIVTHPHPGDALTQYLAEATHVDFIVDTQLSDSETAQKAFDAAHKEIVSLLRRDLP